MDSIQIFSEFLNNYFLIWFKENLAPDFLEIVRLKFFRTFAFKISSNFSNAYFLKLFSKCRENFWQNFSKIICLKQTMSLPFKLDTGHFWQTVKLYALWIMDLCSLIYELIYSLYHSLCVIIVFIKRATHYSRTTAKPGWNESSAKNIVSSCNSTKTMLHNICWLSKVLRQSRTSLVRAKNSLSSSWRLLV